MDVKTPSPRERPRPAASIAAPLLLPGVTGHRGSLCSAPAPRLRARAFPSGAQQSSDREEAGSWASHEPPGREEAARQEQNHRTRRPRGLWRVCRALGAAQLCFTAPQEDKWGSGHSIGLFSHLRFGAITQSLQHDHLLLIPNGHLRWVWGLCGGRGERRGAEEVTRSRNT